MRGARSGLTIGGSSARVERGWRFGGLIFEGGVGLCSIVIFLSWIALIQYLSWIIGF